MSEYFTNGTVELVVNGSSKGQVSTAGENVGSFVRNQASRYGLKSFSVYVDNNKFFTENAGASLDGVTKVEIVAKDSRGGGTWDADEDPGESWTPSPLQTNTSKGAPKLKLSFDRKALIASKQATIDEAESKFAKELAEFESEQKVVKAFIDANAADLAKNFGYKSVEAFNESRRDVLVYQVASTLGFRTNKPTAPNLTTAKAQVATLAAAANDTIEIEEGHPFITHLK